jgi:hypothetical protein
LWYNKASKYLPLYTNESGGMGMRFNFKKGGYEAATQFQAGDVIRDSSGVLKYYVNNTPAAGHDTDDSAYWLTWGGPGTPEYTAIRQVLDAGGSASVDDRLDGMDDTLSDHGDRLDSAEETIEGHTAELAANAAVLNAAKGTDADLPARLTRHDLALSNITPISGTTIPTTSTVGAVGQSYLNLTTGDWYKCAAVNAGVYTWVRRSQYTVLPSQLKDYVRVGINVFYPYDATIGKYLNITGSTEVVDATYAISGYIPVAYNDTYTIDITGLTSSCAYFYDENKVLLGHITRDTSPQTFTVNVANAVYMRVNVRISGRTVNDVMVVIGSTIPAVYQPCVWQAPWLTVKPENLFGDTRRTILPKLYLPSHLYGIAGEKTEIFHKGYISAYDPDMYPNTVPNLYGEILDRKVELTYPNPSAEAGDPLTFSILEPISGYVLGTKSIRYHAMAPIANPGAVKNILIITDSLGAYGEGGPAKFPVEFKRRLMGSGGTPSGLGLTNFAFIGTTGSEDGVLRESRGGWTWDDYTLKHPCGNAATNAVQNPFWNTVSDALDFQNYMTVNGFSGNIDYCIILLGWNNFLVFSDTPAATAAKAKTFIDALKAQYPSCKFLISGIQAVGSKIPVPSGTNQSYYALSLRNMQLGEEYEKICNAAGYTAYCKYVPLACQIDVDYAMSYGDRPVNSRSAATESYCTDTVHLGVVGQLQAADAFTRTFMAL